MHCECVDDDEEEEEWTVVTAFARMATGGWDYE
jgi:hypothetical protein